MVVFRFKKIWNCKTQWFWFGLERLILFITGMNNIRDVIPFPRTPKTQSFKIYPFLFCNFILVIKYA